MPFLKEGQKIWGGVNPPPPPPYLGNARKKTFFFIEAFPNLTIYPAMSMISHEGSWWDILDNDNTCYTSNTSYTIYASTTSNTSDTRNINDVSNISDTSNKTKGARQKLLSGFFSLRGYPHALWRIFVCLEIWRSCTMHFLSFWAKY